MDKLALRTLQDNDRLTYRQLAAILNISIQLAHYKLNKLHKAREIHIVDWALTLGSRHYMPVFASGEGKDVPKPEKMKAKDKCKRWRAKQSLDKILGTKSLIIATLLQLP